MSVTAGEPSTAEKVAPQSRVGARAPIVASPFAQHGRRPGWGVWRQRFSGRSLIVLLTFAVVLFLVAGPLVVMAVATFKPAGVLPFGEGFTLANYREVFLSAATWRLLWNTLAFALGSLALGTSLAVVFSWLVERSDMPYRNLMFALIVAPMAIPGLLAAIAWIFLLDQRIGLLNILIRSIPGLAGVEGPLNVYTLTGMIFIEGIRMAPSIFLMISASFRSMDPSLEEASRVSRKSSFATIRRITLPLMRPAILAAGLYYFIVVIESFDVPGVIGMSAGRHVFATQIYRAASPTTGGLPHYGVASTLGLILVGISVIAIALYGRTTREARGFVTVTGKGFRPRRIPLGKWKGPAVVLCTLYFLVALVLPLVILAWGSLQPFYSPPSIEALDRVSLDAYRTMFSSPKLIGAVRNTLILALLAASATMLVSLFVGWLTARFRTIPIRLLDHLAFVPHAVASIIFALGVLLMYVSFRNPIYGTIYLLGLALTARYLSYGSRLVNAAILQCDPALEEVSLVCGAGWQKTYRRVIIPLVAPALLNGWIWVAVHAARELSAALMLQTPKSIVVSTRIWGYWEAGNASAASAMGVLLILALVVITFGGRVLVSRKSNM